MRKQTPEEPRDSQLASGWKVEGLTEDPVEQADTSANDGLAGDGLEAESLDPESPAQISNLGLVLYGVLGGLYLLYAWVWLSWVQGYAELNEAALTSSGSLGNVLQQIVFWAAPLAPILWFAAAMLLHRGSTVKTVLWILIGAVVLVPLPVFGGGGA